MANNILEEDTAIPELDDLPIFLVDAAGYSRQHAILPATIVEHFRCESQTAITTVRIQSS